MNWKPSKMMESMATPKTKPFLSHLVITTCPTDTGFVLLRKTMRDMDHGVNGFMAPFIYMNVIVIQTHQVNTIGVKKKRKITHSHKIY